MKAYLKPENEMELKRMVKSLDLCLVLWDLDNYLIAQYKYHDNEAARPIREELFRIMSEHSIDLDDLTE